MSEVSHQLLCHESANKSIDALHQKLPLLDLNMYSMSFSDELQLQCLCILSSILRIVPGAFEDVAQLSEWAVCRGRGMSPGRTQRTCTDMLESACQGLAYICPLCHGSISNIGEVLPSKTEGIGRWCVGLTWSCIQPNTSAVGLQMAWLAAVLALCGGLAMLHVPYPVTS